MRVSRTGGFYAAAGVLFAFALQIQLTLFKTESYEGLRVALSDVFLPVIAPVILISLLLKRSTWPQWEKPFGLWAPLLLTATIIFSLFWGWHLQGEIGRWALINKFCGWFVLMAYFGVAAWLGTNGRPIMPFIKAFCAGALAVAVFELLNQALKAHDLDLNIHEDYEALAGFMGNRNAYAFLLSGAAIFTTLFGMRDRLPRFALYAFWIAFPALLIFNGSRTLILCAPVLLVFFAFFDIGRTLRIILPCVAVGTMLFFAVFSPEQKSFFTSVPYKSFSELHAYSKQPDNPQIAEDMKKTGNSHRLAIIGQSVELIRKNTLFGAGLGGALEAQEETYGKPIDVIDNTPLWILTDMGLFGLTAFIACYLAMGHTVLLRRKSEDEMESLLASGAFMMLAVFAVFSLFHEILYTRFFWFILGLALSTRLRQSAGPALPR